MNTFCVSSFLWISLQNVFLHLMVVSLLNSFVPSFNGNFFRRLLCIFKKKTTKRHYSVILLFASNTFIFEIRIMDLLHIHWEIYYLKWTISRAHLLHASFPCIKEHFCHTSGSEVCRGSFLWREIVTLTYNGNGKNYCCYCCCLLDFGGACPAIKCEIT